MCNISTSAFISYSVKLASCLGRVVLTSGQCYEFVNILFAHFLRCLRCIQKYPNTTYFPCIECLTEVKNNFTNSIFLLFLIWLSAIQRYVLGMFMGKFLVEFFGEKIQGPENSISDDLRLIFKKFMRRF